MSNQPRTDAPKFTQITSAVTGAGPVLLGLDADGLVWLRSGLGLRGKSGAAKWQLLDETEESQAERARAEEAAQAESSRL